MMRVTPQFAIIVSVIFASSVAFANPPGPEWGEENDAGGLPGGSQTPMGFGSLGTISGTMGGSPFPGEIDFVDMFLINIVDPLNFRASTDPDDMIFDNAFANFNTQLWLFQAIPGGEPNATGFLGNDVSPETGNPQSLLLPIPTDGQPPLVDPGLYYIAITRQKDPISDIGEIFNQKDPQEISGPDGPGGMLPIIGWTEDKGGAFEGVYVIRLQGVEFVPAPGALGLLAIAGLSARKRRRR